MFPLTIHLQSIQDEDLRYRATSFNGGCGAELRSSIDL